MALSAAAARACPAITWRPPVLATWDHRPQAEDDEVVLKIRLLRVELQDAERDGPCYPAPAVFVFEVVDVAEGAFKPTEIFLYGSGAPDNPEQTGWLVGKPATLYTKYVAQPKDGAQLPAERPSIEWRPPPCQTGFVCSPPNVRVLQP